MGCSFQRGPPHILTQHRLEAVRHCRWVDEVVAEAPWIMDQAFLDKYQIDYVAHDEVPYAAVGHADVYELCKSQGVFLSYFDSAPQANAYTQANSSPRSERRVCRHRSCWSAS